MKAIKYLAIVAASVFFITSCTKEVAGPTGPTGATGAQGPAATYNVIFDSVSGTGTGWTGSNPYNFTITDNSISTTDYNIVEVYFSTQQGSNKTWTELPVGNIYAASDYFFFNYSIYNVNIQYDNSTANAAASAGTPYMYFKVVVITQP